MAAGQYVARDVENIPVVPQPPDVEITDAFGNIFDNFNQYGTPGPPTREVAFYDANNVLLNPQPAYQNENYVERTVDNQPASPPWEPDAAQWVPKGVDNVTRTPAAYVKSPLWPDGPPEWYGTSTLISVPIEVEQGEAYIVDEADVLTIMTTGLQGNEEEPLS